MTAEPPQKPRRWLPRFAAREIEVHGEAGEGAHDHHEEAGWRIQLVASLGCLIMAVAGYWADSPPVALAFYILSYVAGSWFTLGEVWEKVRDGVLDVHFLMLA